VANVSAASFQGQELAPDSIVAAFGNGLATQVQAATTLPLPSVLAGTTVKIKDNTGLEQSALLFFVAPTQINYYLPAGFAPGPALVTVRSGTGQSFTGNTQLARVAPGLFSADS